MPTDEQITQRLTRRQPDWWSCRGCGARFDARTDTDLIVDHVRGCDLVDGAGQPDRRRGREHTRRPRRARSS